jgi:hypothetical protein
VRISLPFLPLRSARPFVWATAATLVAVGPLPGATPSAYQGPITAGALEAPPHAETSGITFSRRAPDILWTHDDSGGAPILYAVDSTGRKRGALHLKGASSEDWEDVASFERAGKAWLLVADIGDNDAKRSSVLIHVVAEPAPERLKPNEALEDSPAYSLRIRYADGPRDCEAVAVDPVEGAIYLLTKRDEVPRLYRVPLAASREKHVVAQFLGTVPRIVGTASLDTMVKRLAGKRFSWPTGMDIAADGRAAVVLTYGEILLFTREGTEAWPDTFKRAPLRLPFHGLPQAEAVCFSRDGKSIYVASETTTAFIRYDQR